MRKHCLLYINNSTTNETSKKFLTVVHVVIHIGSNNGDTNRTSKLLWKIEKYKINIFYKTKLKAERKARSTG